MGHAIESPANDAILRTHPHLSFRIGNYTYTVETKGTVSTYTVTDGAGTISLPILWGFGVNAQTWMVERNGRLHETMVSYYPETNGLDVTIGDNGIKIQTLEEAIGREQSDLDAVTCFKCHTTNAVSNGQLTLATMKQGVTCEHCHTGADTHLADAVLGRMNTHPPSLGKLSSEDLSKFCGQCHRTWETIVRSHWKGPVTARFQPYRLANSRCFDGTDSRISCIACHNPHEDLVKTDSYYDGKCLACHTTAAAAVTRVSATQAAPRVARICPVAQSKCVSCHMPKVTLPGVPSTFTDHQIRIVKPGEAFPG